MRSDNMPRPFAPEHSGQQDLAETLRRLFAMSTPTDNAEVANDSPELECVFVNERPAVFFSTLREAADELARMRAEVAENKREIDELVRSLKLCTQRAERAEARVREAPVVHADTDNIVEVANELGYYDGKRVALVRLDAEEGV